MPRFIKFFLGSKVPEHHGRLDSLQTDEEPRSPSSAPLTTVLLEEEGEEAEVVEIDKSKKKAGFFKYSD